MRRNNLDNSVGIVNKSGVLVSVDVGCFALFALQRTWPITRFDAIVVFDSMNQEHDERTNYRRTSGQ